MSASASAGLSIPPGSLPGHGSLAEWPLARLLLALERHRFTGSLALSRGHVSKRVLFAEGAPIVAESNLASESLGVMLLDQGRLSRADHARLSQRVQEKGCKEGAGLLELRLLDPKELFLALKEQLRRRLLECFAWQGGEWRLDAGETAPSEAGAFRVDVVRLVHDGLEAHASPERLLAWLAPAAGQTLVPAPSVRKLRARLRADAGVDSLLMTLDGRCTLGEAITRVREPGALAAACVMLALGALVPPQGSAPELDRNAISQSDGIDVEVVIGDGAEAAGDAALAGDAARTGAARTSASMPDAVAARAELERLHARLGELSFYELLGVAAEASAAEVKRAYLQAAKRWHPDALVRQGLDDLRDVANSVFARMSKAHSVLSDPSARRHYDEEQAGAGNADADRLATAETLYRKGEILLRKGAFVEALQFLEPAASLWPTEAAYRLACGWALYKQPASDPKRARAELEAAVEIDPADGVAHYRLGVVLRALGEASAAADALARAKALEAKTRRV